MGIYHGANPLAPCPRLARQIGYNGRSKKPKLKADLGNHIGSQIVQLSLSHESRTAEEKDEPQEMKAKKLKQTGRTIHDLTTDCQFFLLSCHAHCNLSFEQNVNRDVESRKQKKRQSFDLQRFRRTTIAITADFVGFQKSMASIHFLAYHMFAIILCCEICMLSLHSAENLTSRLLCLCQNCKTKTAKQHKNQYRQEPEAAKLSRN